MLYLLKICFSLGVSSVMNSNLRSLTSESRLTRLQFLCLFITGMLACASVVLAHNATYSLQNYISLVFACIFFVATCIQKPKCKLSFSIILAFITISWFFILQLFPHVKQLKIHHYGLFLSTYLLAFPFSRVTRDENRQIGLRITAVFYIAAALALIGYAVILFSNAVPVFLQNNIHWDGTRLKVLVHPNASARVFMIGIAFCLSIFHHIRSKGIRIFLLTAAVLMFLVQSLTNSRAAILMTCLLVAGTVFFSLSKGGCKRFFLGAIAGLAVLVVLFLSSQEIFRWHESRLNAVAAAQAERAQQLSVSSHQVTESHGVVLLSNRTPSQNTTLTDTPDTALLLSAAADQKDNSDPASPQNSFLQDLPTLNNRTRIWASLLHAVQEDPSILLWGTNDMDELIEEQIGRVSHAHNAWLEVLFYLGLPGLIISLCFTAQAAWSSIRLLFHRQVTLEKKIISLLLLCLLVASTMEPSLFFTDKKWHFANFIFFLCLGYVSQWRRQLPKSKKRLN